MDYPCRVTSLPSRANGAARPSSQNIWRSHAAHVCPCRQGFNHGKDDLVAERTPRSDRSPDTSEGQLSVGSATALPGDGSPLLALEKQIQRNFRGIARGGAVAPRSEEISRPCCTVAGTIDDRVHVLESIPLMRSNRFSPVSTPSNGRSCRPRHARWQDWV